MLVGSSKILLTLSNLAKILLHVDNYIFNIYLPFLLYLSSHYYTDIDSEVTEYITQYGHVLPHIACSNRRHCMFISNIERIFEFNTLKTSTFNIEGSLVSSTEVYHTGINNI